VKVYQGLDKWPVRAPTRRLILPVGFKSPGYSLPVYYVYVNMRKRRVYLTTRKIADDGWTLIAVRRRRRLAMSAARGIADKLDYVLEWDSPTCG